MDYPRLDRKRLWKQIAKTVAFAALIVVEVFVIMWLHSQIGFRLGSR